MIKSLSIKISQYLEGKNSSLTKKDILKIQYVLEVILGDSIKFSIIFLIFFFLHELKLFFLIFIILNTTRPFMGGVHCKTFNSCLLWSVIYFSSISIFSLCASHFNIEFYISSFTIFFIVTLAFAPGPNEKRPVKNNGILKILSLISLTLWSILFFKLPNIQINNCIFVSLFLQMFQLIYINLKRGVFNGKFFKYFFNGTT